jgi:RNA polymerase sigma factor (sigma-70 family)
MSATHLDSLYAAYKAASEDQKTIAREALISGMYREAWPITWSRLRGAYPDIVSDSVTKAVLNLEKFRGEARFSTWFYKIVMNFCNMALRSLISRPEEISLEEAAEEGAELMVDPVHETNVTLDLTAVAELLTDEERDLLALRREGYTYPEISAKTGASETALRLRMYRLAKRFAQERRARGRRSALVADFAKKDSAQ